MPFIKKISAKNFRCFRRATSIDLSQSTYLVGINNSGKTAMLSAINCFFDSSAYKQDYLNKTEFLAKQEGFNRSEITITFDLLSVTGSARKSRMVGLYGNSLDVLKTFTYREASKTILEEYSINGNSFSFDKLEEDIQFLIKSVSISYIHPQEGQQLLERAQLKFKERLFNNWGRHPSVSEKLNELQQQWDELRRTANSYLSSALTNNLRKIWPQSNTKVNLPERIKDIVAVSDISFRSSPALPEVTLPSQGTGAQSTILYQTHYILDSDRSLHRGMYFPVWLLEEPESFLHADIAFQLAKLLNSKEWLASIQMIISTHSPIVLSASSQNAEQTRWAIFENYSVLRQKPANELNNNDIMFVGQKMGDTNFDAYFTASVNKTRVIIEDRRPLTKTRFADAGIPVEAQLEGSSQIKKFIETISAMPSMVNGRIFFLIDNDKGRREVDRFIKAGRVDSKSHDIKRICLFENTYLILFPENFATEDLFAEFDGYLEGCCKSIFNEDYSCKANIPSGLSRTVGAIKGKRPPSTLNEAKNLIRKEQEIKDGFWEKIESEGYKIAAKYESALKYLLEHPQ